MYMLSMSRARRFVKVSGLSMVGERVGKSLGFRASSHTY